MLFFLLGAGISEDSVYGYHDGWDFDRLHRAFLYYKSREIESHSQDALAVAIGASALVKADSFKKFQRVVREAADDMKAGRRAMDPASQDEAQRRSNERVAEVFKSLGAFISSGGKGKL